MSTDTYMTNLLGAFATAVAARIDQHVAEVGLRGTNAATALVTIYNHPDDTIDVLRRILGLTHSGAVRLINGLEEDKLVVRRRSSSDGRAVTIRLTRKGEISAAEVLEARAQVTKSIMVALDAKQQAALSEALRVSLAAMTDGQDKARQICRLCNESVCRPQGCPVEIAAEQGV